MFSSSIVLSLVSLVSVLFIGVGSVVATGTAIFNNDTKDLDTLRIMNYEVSAGTYNWSKSVTANAGDRIAIDVYYHNTVTGTTATNTKMRVSFPTAASTQMSFSGSLWADNAAQVSDTVNLNIASSQTIVFENTARWRPNQQATGGELISAVNNGNSIEVNIGDVTGGWPSQGHVTFYATISNNTTNQNPVVDAGSDVSVNEGSSVTLSGSANDSDGDAMTYSWSCTNGSLSSSTSLSTTYNAPSVSSNTTYVCTLTARDSKGGTGTDTVNVTVINQEATNHSPVVDAGSNVSVNENDSITLSGSANDSDGDAMTYSWSCTGGSLSNSASLSTTYYAPSVSYTTTYNCTLTARDSKGYTGSDTISVTVMNTNYDNENPVVDAGSSLSVNEGSSVSLSGSAYDPQGDSLTYSWACSGGSLSNYSSLYTTYYAPSVSYTTTYNCTLTVRDSKGYTGSDTVSVTVIDNSYNYDTLTVDAGSNKDIQENQSTTLNGYAYSQGGYVSSQYWSCNGGSLSNSNSLTPTYYAPSVSVDTTYTCTLFVTDSRGNRNSDTVNIIVRNIGSNYVGGLSVTTATPNVGNNYATLKGVLTNDGGQYTSVRFSWGRLSSYSNTTSWITNKTSGQSFDYYVSGLEKGKAYHYRAEASNGSQTVLGQDVVFVTKPDPTTGFNAVAAGSGQISLSWNKGEAACYTIVTRKAKSYPTNSADGTVVYFGTGSSVIDRNLYNNVWYYYRAWSVGCDEGMYSYSESQYARAYTVGEYVPPIVTPVKVETGISVETLVRDITQNGIAWQNLITANPGDEVEFRIIVTPTGEKSLQNVTLRTIISDKISNIRDIKVNESSSCGSSLSGAFDLGTIALGESKIVTFKGTVDSKESFSYGSNELVNTVDVSAKNNTTVSKTMTVDVIRSAEGSAGLISLLDLRFWAGFLLLLFLILCIIVIYLLIERKRDREYVAEREAENKIEKSKYFNIK